MDDLLKTIKAQLYDRLSSPLTFSFSLAWLFWNYRIIVILLSTLSPPDKFFAIELLSLEYERPILYWLCHLAIGPVCTAAAYIFIVPWLEQYVFEFTLNRKKALKKLRQKIEDDTPISEDEARELRALSDNLYREHRAALKDRDEEIARLKVAMRQLQEHPRIEPEGDSQRTSSESETLSPAQEELLRYVATQSDGGSYATFGQLVEISGEKQIKVQYNLDVLLRRNLIEEKLTNNNVGGFYLSVDGRAFCVEKLSMDLI